MSNALRARLTGRAARFIGLLQDFGHLDDEGVDRLVVRLAERHGDQHGAPVDLADVRRAAAVVLFESSPQAEDGTGLLAEDWSLLFH